MKTVLFVLLQESNGDLGGLMQYIPVVLMVIVMYFFFIRPQAKKRKQAEEYRNSLQKGDNVVTIGGIHGKITEVNDTTVVISTLGGKLLIERSALSATSNSSEEEVAINK